MVKRTLNDLKQYVYDIMNTHESSESSLATEEISDHIRNSKKRKQVTSEISDASSFISYDELMSEPSPPQTALQYYLNERLTPILQSLKNHLNPTNAKPEVEALLQRQWDKMTPFERFRFEQKADQDYERYLNEMHELHLNSVGFTPKRAKIDFINQQQDEQTFASCSNDHITFNSNSRNTMITEDDISYLKDFSNFDLLSDEFIHCFSSDEEVDEEEDKVVEDLSPMNSNYFSINSIYPPIDFSYPNNIQISNPLLFPQDQSTIISSANNSYNNNNINNNNYSNYLAISSTIYNNNNTNTINTSNNTTNNTNITTTNTTNNITSLLSIQNCQQEYSIIALKLLSSVMKAGH